MRNIGSLKQLVDDNDIVVIEAGLNGGYVVTLGDTQSDEQRSIYEAIKQAKRRLVSN